jgi:hypothetical protein
MSDKHQGICHSDRFHSYFRLLLNWPIILLMWLNKMSFEMTHFPVAAIFSALERNARVGRDWQLDDGGANGATVLCG